MQFPTPDYYAGQNQRQSPIEVFMQLILQKQQLDQRKQERDEKFKNQMKLLNDEFKKNKELKEIQFKWNMREFEAKQEAEIAQEQQQFEQSVIRAQTGVSEMEQGIKGAYSDRTGRRPMPGQNYPLTPQGQQIQSMMPAIRGGATQGQQIPVSQVLQTQRAAMPKQAAPMNPLQKAQMDKINQEMKLLFQGDPESPQFKAKYPGPARIGIAEEKIKVSREALDLKRQQFKQSVKEFSFEVQQALAGMEMKEQDAVTDLAEVFSGGDPLTEQHAIEAIKLLAKINPAQYQKHADKIKAKEGFFGKETLEMQKPKTDDELFPVK